MNNNTKPVVSSALEGTKTLENLKQAFTKEAEAFVKGSIYSLLANESGDMSASRAIAEMSDNDRRHAELWLGYLDELGDTLEITIFFIFLILNNYNTSINSTSKIKVL